MSRSKWSLAWIVALVAMMSGAGVASAQNTNNELWELTGLSTRNVYICPACTLDQFLSAPLPGSDWTRNVSDGDARLFLPDSGSNTPPIEYLPPGSSLTLDLVPEIEGDDHFFIARVLGAQLLRFGTQGPMARARVARGTTLVFDAGRVIHKVTEPTGRQYVLFSMSEIHTSTWDPAVLNGLAGIGLPRDWTYSSEVLSERLVIGTPGGVANVFTVEGYWTWQELIVVPEPSTALSVGLGLAWLARRRRREE